MDVKTALAKRKSTRAFLNKEVPITTVNAILEQAKTAPSGVNTQPWKVAVLSGQSKKDLEQKMESEFRAGNKGTMDYQYYPEQWEAEYKQRRKACGLLMYSTLQSVSNVIGVSLFCDIFFFFLTPSSSSV